MVKLVCFFLIMFVAQSSSAKQYDDSPSLGNLSREFSLCQTIFDNTGKNHDLSQCVDSVFARYDGAIQDSRQQANFANKTKWTEINNTINNQWLLCSEAARISQDNRSILIDTLSCEHIKYRSLLFEAIKLKL